MKIVVLGLASEDVSADLRALQCLFGDAFGAALARESLLSNVQTLFFTPIVTRPGIGPFPDKLSYLRREPAVNASVNLSYQRWIEGDQSERVTMVAQALLGVIAQIKDKKLDPQAKAGLKRIVEDVRKSLAAEAQVCADT